MELLLLNIDSEVEQIITNMCRARSLVCRSVSDIDAALEKLQSSELDAVLLSLSWSGPRLSTSSATFSASSSATSLAPLWSSGAAEAGARSALVRACRARGAAILLLLDDVALLGQLDDETRGAIDDFVLPPHDAAHVGARLDMVVRRRRAEAQIRSAAMAKQAFAARVLSIQEAERQHLSRELHDSISQLLLVHRMDAEWLAGQTDSEPVRDAAERLCTGLDETLHLVRTLAMELRPPAIDDLGIDSAIETLCSDAARRSGIHCRFEGDRRTRALPEEIAVTMYRIAQEALTNAVRHAKCRNVQVHLIQHARSVELRVTDDGIGIAPDHLADTTTFGLVGMRERAELVGGHVSIHTGLNQGTSVRAMFPYTSHRPGAVNTQAPPREGNP
jgi:signal transduction histidine kinase